MQLKKNKYNGFNKKLLKAQNQAEKAGQKN